LRELVQENSKDALISSFRATGIVPFDQEEVLKRMQTSKVCKFALAGIPYAMDLP